MTSKLALAAGGLLGLAFIVFGLNYFLNFIPMPPPEKGTPPAMFLGAMAGSGYFAFVKILEIAGGLLVAIPKTRNLGLLVLGPIIVNILAFNIFFTNGAGLAQPPVIAITVLGAFLLWAERKAFLKLIS